MSTEELGDHVEDAAGGRLVGSGPEDQDVCLFLITEPGYQEETKSDTSGFVFNVCVLWSEQRMPPQRKQGQVPKNPLPPSKPQ